MREGELIDARFEIEERTAVGGMGEVYRARDRSSGGLVAVKVLHDLGEEAVARFARECALLASISHPGVVGHVAHGETSEKLAYLVMEWVDGPTLSSRLREGSLSVAESLELVGLVAEAAGALHERGIVHRDLKPSNIVLAGGDPRRPKLLDLGIARGGLVAAGITIQGSMLGSPSYMSPEQARGARDVDARSDVFALGCIAFRCLTGQTPFVGEDALAVLLRIAIEDAPRLVDRRADVPPELDAVVARMLSRDPDLRPPDGRAVARLFRGLSEPGVRTPLPPPPSRDAPVRKREKRTGCVMIARRPGNEPIPVDDLTWSRLVSSLRSFSATPHLLADGTLVVLVDEPRWAAVDLALAGVRSAVRVRRLVPDACIVVVTGRGAALGPTATGPTLDLAGSLLAEATSRGPTGVVMCDGVTAGLVETSFVCTPEGSGHRVVMERPTEGFRTLLGRPSACVGREPELARLRELCADAIGRGLARMVLVTAPAGVGKSRLRHELLAGIDRSVVEVWVARGDSMRRGSAFGMLGPLVARLAGLGATDAPDEAWQKLVARVGAWVPPAEVSRVAALLGEACGVPPPSTDPVAVEAVSADPLLLGDRIRKAFADFVGAEVATRPVVFVLEDLHWGDRASLGCVDVALARHGDKPLFVLGLGRPEVRDVLGPALAERAPIEIALGPLPDEAARALVRGALGDRAEVGLVESVVARGAGNAFFLEELVRAVHQGGDLGLPASVAATVEARLAELDVEARRVLRAGSVFGQRFWLGGVRALVGFDPTASLERLVEQEILLELPTARFAGDRELSFRQSIVGEAAYGMLTDEDRVSAHREAARWLASSGESNPVVLGEHLERSGEPQKALPQWLRAAHQALEGLDLDGAIGWAERALAGGAADAARGQLLRLVSEARLWKGAYGEATEAGRDALAILPEGGESACAAATSVLLGAGATGDVETLEVTISIARGLPLAGEAVGARIVLAAQAAIESVIEGRRDVAESLLARIESGPAGGHVDDRASAHALRARAYAALSRGDVGAHARDLAASSERIERLGDGRQALVGRTLAGTARLLSGDVDGALRALVGARDAGLELGLGPVAATARLELARALATAGRGVEAEAEARTALAWLEQHGDRRRAAQACTLLAEIHRGLGAQTAAIDWARRALVLLPRPVPARARALSALGRALLAMTRGGGSGVGEAFDVSSEASHLSDSLGGLHDGETQVRLCHALALAAVGDDEGASLAARAAARRIETMAGTLPLADRERFLAAVPEHAETFALAATLAAR